MTITTAVLLSACADVGAPVDDTGSAAPTADTTGSAAPTADATGAATSTSTSTTDGTIPVTSRSCDEIAATFRDVTSANADLPDPELTTSCEGEMLVVTGNGIPDYPYVETSPGTPREQVVTFEIPLTPVLADEPQPIALLGPVAVAVDGIPIYGPTEGTGGDVLSLEGALSHCGSHNGPTGFHIHLVGWAQGTDCLVSADEAEAGSVLVGWSFDGFPIYSGVVCVDDACSETQQLSSGWSLLDESLFATDTWSAHTYVAGTGDLDECNGRVTDGEYRYYTTTTFPYVLGCTMGVVEVPDDAGAGDPPGGGPPPQQP